VQGSSRGHNYLQALSKTEKIFTNDIWQPHHPGTMGTGSPSRG